MPYKLITDATVEPISVSDALNYLKVDSTSSPDVSLIGTLITAARRRAENFTHRTFITQTWQCIQDSFTNHSVNVTRADLIRSMIAYTSIQAIGVVASEPFIELHQPPVQSVSWIKYYDMDGTLQTLDSSYYVLDTANEPARITLAYGKTWPSIQYIPNCVTVQYVTGYGAASTNVPSDIIMAIYLDVAHMYEHREAVTSNDYREMPMAWQSLLWPYRVMSM